MTWFWKLLGYHVCEEFTQWELKQADFSKAGYYLGGLLIPFDRPVEFTRRWQERKCKQCGKTQIQQLPFGENIL